MENSTDKRAGFFFIVPVMDKSATSLTNVRVTDITAESMFTKDTVPVRVNAIFLWTVWDVEKAAMEVRKYVKAVSLCGSRQVCVTRSANMNCR